MKFSLNLTIDNSSDADFQWRFLNVLLSPGVSLNISYQHNLIKNSYKQNIGSSEFKSPLG